MLPPLRKLADDLERRYSVRCDVWSLALSKTRHTLGLEVWSDQPGLTERVSYIIDLAPIRKRPIVERCILRWSTSHWPRNLLHPGSRLNTLSWRKLGRSLRIVLQAVEPTLLAPPKPIKPAGVLISLFTSARKDEPDLPLLGEGEVDYRHWAELIKALPAPVLLSPSTFATPAYLGDPGKLHTILKKVEPSITFATVKAMYQASKDRVRLENHFGLPSQVRFFHYPDSEDDAIPRIVAGQFPGATEWLTLLRVGSHEQQALFLYYDNSSYLGRRRRDQLWAVFSEGDGDKRKWRKHPLPLAELARFEHFALPRHVLAEELAETTVEGVRQAVLLDSEHPSLRVLSVTFDDGREQVFTVASTLGLRHPEAVCARGILLTTWEMNVPKILEECVLWKSRTDT